MELQKFKFDFLHATTQLGEIKSEGEVLALVKVSTIEFQTVDHVTIAKINFLSKVTLDKH